MKSSYDYVHGPQGTRYITLVESGFEALCLWPCILIFGLFLSPFALIGWLVTRTQK